jgi:hypothetical protein
MDKQSLKKELLKKELLKLVEVFKEEGQKIELLGVIPVYPDISSTSFVVQIYSTWLNEKPNYFDAIKAVTSKIYSMYPSSIIRYINRVDVCTNNSEIHCMADELIVNDINYQPLAYQYNFSEA